MSEEEKEVLASVHNWLAAKRKVQDWMHAEGLAGNLRTNDQCPHWQEYVHAQKRYGAALDALADLMSKNQEGAP